MSLEQCVSQSVPEVKYLYHSLDDTVLLCSDGLSGMVNDDRIGVKHRAAYSAA